MKTQKLALSILALIIGACSQNNMASPAGKRNELATAKSSFAVSNTYTCDQDVSLWGQAMNPGNIYTIMGRGLNSFWFNALTAVAVDTSGNVFAGTYFGKVYMMPKEDGTYFGSARLKNVPFEVTTAAGAISDLATDYQGNLFIGEYLGYGVRMIPKANGTYFGIPMTAENVYVVAGEAGFGYNGDGIDATTATFGYIHQITCDDDGNLYICDNYNGRLRMIPREDDTYFGQPMAKGKVYTIAGNGLTSTYTDQAAANTSIAPTGVAVDSSKNIYLAVNGNVAMIPSASGTNFGRSMPNANHIYTISGNFIQNAAGNAVPAGEANVEADSLALDADGNIFINHGDAGLVRMIAKQCGIYFDRKVRENFIYHMVGNGAAINFGGDGEAASHAYLNNANGDIAFDPEGNLYIEDGGNGAVRMVPRSQ